MSIMTMEQPIEEQALSGAICDTGIVQSSEIRPPCRDEMLVAPSPRNRSGPHLDGAARNFLVLTALGGIGACVLYGSPDIFRQVLSSEEPVQSVVEQIVHVESSGCATLKNKRSTATGPAQFIEETWLCLIQKHRPDLAHKDREQILALRRDHDLSREMAARYADQNATVLRKHDISVNAGTLYLSHFAGVAGAVAIMSAPDAEDAAEIMANADATGRMTRNIIVRANPFLENFTIADLKKWAEQKMLKKRQKPATVSGSCPQAT